MDNKFSSGHQTEQCKYVGIDVHLRRFTIACLDENLQIQFIEDFSLDELLERIESVSPLIIGVDSPLGLNNGLMDDEQYRKKLRLETNTHHNKKVSEYELTRRGISLYSTPDSVDGVSGWKSWMGTGMQFFEKIKPMGYIHVNTNTDIDKGIVEVFPHACFTTLAGRLLEKKTSDAGLQERIQVLENAGISGFEKYLAGSKHCISDKLDAIIAAYTAFVVSQKRAIFVGDAVEGCIALPVNEIKQKYEKGPGAVPVKNELPNSTDLRYPTYSYKNVDAVVWLKYFVPIGNTPPIAGIINFGGNPDSTVILKIQSHRGKHIQATFEPMKNRADGMKVVFRDKERLKAFWGSHGDKQEYQVEVIKVIS